MKKVHVDESGKNSITKYRILEIISGNFGNVSFLEVKPITGRTHQIRVHCQHVGNSVIGDIKYGNSEFNENIYKIVGQKRLCLHAKSISLMDPLYKKVINVDAPLGKEMGNIISILQKKSMS